MSDNRPGTEVFLPSKGLPYGGLLPNGSVEVISMTTTDEKMFAGISKKMDFENVIDTLIRRCTKLPAEIKPSNLYVGDRVFLMMYIRAVSYGTQYGFKVQCTECQARWDHDLDIMNDLEVRELSDDHQDPFKIELPINGDTVTLKLFRGDDERSIIRYVDQQNKKVNLKQIGDPGYTYRLALHLLGVDSSSDPNDTFSEESLAAKPGALLACSIDYIDKLAAADSSVVRDEIEARTPGLNMLIEMECPKCLHGWTMGMPITADFFRAKSTAGVRTTARVVPRSAR